MAEVMNSEDLEQRVKELEKEAGQRKHAENALKTTELFLNRVIDQSPFATWISDANGTLQHANPALKKILNLTDEQLVGKYNILDDPLAKRQGLLPLFRTVFEDGKTIHFTCQWDGNNIPTLDLKGSNSVSIEATMFPIHDLEGKLTNVVHHWVDVTERSRHEQVLKARLKLSEMAVTQSVDDLLQVLLDEVEALTGSSIGFFHFLEPDQETLSLQMWPTNTLNWMCTAEGKNLHYAVSRAGVWVDAVRGRRPVIHNDYESLPHRKGMPEGHATVIRELVVPISREGKIQAILGVGNKKTDYTEEDTNIMVELADLAWDIVLKKQAQEAMKNSEEKYRLLAENISDTIWTMQLSEHRFSYISPSVERLLGYTAPEMMGLLPEDYLTQESMIKWSNAISRELEKQSQGISEPERSLVLQLDQIKKDKKKSGPRSPPDFFVNFRDDDPGTFFGKSIAESPAEPLSGAGNDNHLILEFHPIPRFHDSIGNVLLCRGL